MKSKYYLPHIDGLRAIAVISVITYHFNETLLLGGYLGVDIFFVISGFVITGYLSRNRGHNTTQYFIDFYLRRLKRLVPALVLCLIFTTLAFALLTTRPPKEIFQTAAFAVFGMSNVFMWLQSTDYFSLASTLNPFTHTWSLGVEEQFYLVYPALLAILGMAGPMPREKRYAYPVLLIITFLSLVSFIVLSRLHPAAGFFLLPSRAWELGVGCLTYYAFEKGVRSSGWPLTLAIICICSALLLPEEFRISATIAAVTGTAILLLMSPQNSLGYNFLISKPVVWIGLLSYSLYLWHWPILVLGKHTIGMHGLAPIIIFALFTLLAISSYYLVERPLRHLSLTSSPKREILLYSIILVALSATLWSRAPNLGASYNNVLADYFDIPPVKNWMVDCHGKLSLKEKTKPYEECLAAARSADKPSVLYLIGDSHAAQLWFMFKEATADTPYQLKFINDEQFPALMINGGGASPTFATAIQYMKKGDLVAIAFHRGHLNRKRDIHIPLSSDITTNKKSEFFLEAFSKQVDSINGAGGRLMIIRDTPLMGAIATSPSCRLQIELFGSSSCEVSRKQDMHTRTRQDRVYDELLSRYPSACLWDPLDYIYRGAYSIDVIDSFGEYIMWDWNHITQRVSERLATDFIPALQHCISRSKKLPNGMFTGL